MKKLKGIPLNVLATFTLIAVWTGCDSDFEKVENTNIKSVIIMADLASVISTDVSFDNYIVSTANNIMIFRGLSRDQFENLAEQRASLLKEPSLSKANEFIATLSRLGYDMNAQDHYLGIKNRLDLKYFYETSDLSSVLGEAVETYMSVNYRPRSNGKEPIGAACVPPCQAAANAAYDSQIEAAEGSDRAILSAMKQAYFAGCYEFCVAHPGGVD
jgi:hypothetical protein